MSHRPIEQKKRRRVAKKLRREPLPAYFDLVEHLTSRGHARSRREARELILAKKVKSESHVLGITQQMVPDKTSLIDFLAGRPTKMVQKDVVAPLVDTKLRKSLTVLA